MRFIHTADLQLGERFVGFGEHADTLRRARMQTFERILQCAQEHQVDALLIAGDLFEDNQVDTHVIHEAFSIISQYPDVPLYILPGNHDTCTGPASIWGRPPFADPPPHVTILRQAAPVYVDDTTVLLPRPLTQKQDRHDPSRDIAELVRDIDPNLIRIGITHGSPAIEGKHRPDDHPIALDAADAAGLHYLAIGHWHSWGAYNQGRMIMPGTPEPDSFHTQDAGNVAFVEIPYSDSTTPQIEKTAVNTYTWRHTAFDMTAGHEDTQATLLQRLQDQLTRLSDDRNRTVLRLQLTGTLPQDWQQNPIAAVQDLLDQYAVTQIDDQTFTAISPAELQVIKEQSPIIAQVLADLANVQRYFNPDTADTIPTDLTPMNPPEFERLLARQFSDIEGLKDIDASLIRTARQLLLRELGGIRR